MVKSSVRAWFISQLTGGLIYLFSEEVFSFAHALINIRNRKTIVIWIKLTLTVNVFVLGSCFGYETLAAANIRSRTIYEQQVFIFEVCGFIFEVCGFIFEMNSRFDF